jgi:hypothetical protein
MTLLELLIYCFSSGKELHVKPYCFLIGFLSSVCVRGEGYNILVQFAEYIFSQQGNVLKKLQEVEAWIIPMLLIPCHVKIILRASCQHY